MERAAAYVTARARVNFEVSTLLEHLTQRMSPRPWKFTILALCGSMAACSALALGFGRMPESTVFGQPLDLTLPLRLEPGETLAPGCLSAEVHVGEQRLTATSLQLAVESSNAGSRLRLRSPVVVLEPLVSVNVSVRQLMSSN